MSAAPIAQELLFWALGVPNTESIANMSDHLSRRAILKGLGLAVGVAATMRTPKARAAEPVHLDVNDPAAVKVGYVLEAGHVDPKKQPTYVAGSNCDNCLLLQGKPGNTYRPCSLFPGKLVKISGWCNAWTAEM